MWPWQFNFLLWTVEMRSSNGSDSCVIVSRHCAIFWCSLCRRNRGWLVPLLMHKIPKHMEWECPLHVALLFDVRQMFSYFQIFFFLVLRPLPLFVLFFELISILVTTSRKIKPRQLNWFTILSSWQPTLKAIFHCSSRVFLFRYYFPCYIWRNYHPGSSTDSRDSLLYQAYFLYHQ